MDSKELPDRLLIITLFLSILAVSYVINDIPLKIDHPFTVVTSSFNDSGYNIPFVLIGGNSFKGTTVLYSLRFESLGMLLDEIIKRESNGDPLVCNKQYGCKAGMGLTQLIPSTVKYCEEKLGKEIDPFNPEDNIECATWLLENEGIKHWQSEDGSWGSGPYDLTLYENLR